MLHHSHTKLCGRYGRGALRTSVLAALQCYECDYAGCLFPSKKTCGLLESCVTYKATFGVISVSKKGCINPTQCWLETSETYLGITAKTTPSCCITDLCNSAAMPRVSAITGIALLVTLWLSKLI
uniref:UPAR/Ly6 domain-containing protein n=1 Tax=Leptobrachium leishanense TaxID=445787 RepID=A0A8C5QZ58_9ANUR